MSFNVYIKADDIYEDITEAIKTRCDISNCELSGPPPDKKNKKFVGLSCCFKSKSLYLLNR